MLSHRMEWDSMTLLVILGVLPLVRGNPLPPDATSPFQYDWHRLRVAGLVVAAVLCVVGIIVLLSGKCKCGSKARRRYPPPESSHLIAPGATSTC
ncbi:FXYD domain-containing ion transport regulator 3 isoform X1 [Pezoporus wallicus]|uniref:FXYD domain-containing ion transport regulator 3 isoform X1 n=1 Tax=Pezoporus wallicus TaxID=35540 RepID=UPI00254E604F|nr:FXYD domain-containing ion transport regulator 3 isoform X1 [Pezoporus wallicus]